MATKNKKTARRERIKRGIRGKVTGTSARPRLTVFRSNTAIYAQIIDDEQARTLASASSLTADKKTANVADAHQVGKQLAERAFEKGITRVVFDRNGYLYHGKVKSLAEGAREGGLEF